jgi:hypothetical protein
MRRDEHQPQQIIADFIIGFRFDRSPILPCTHLKLVHQRVFAVPHPRVSQVVEGTAFGSGREPGAWIVGNSAPGPVFERRDEGILSKLLGEPNIAYQAGKTCNEPRRLDSPDDVYGAGDIRGFHDHGCHHVDAGSASQGHLSRKLLHRGPARGVEQRNKSSGDHETSRLLISIPYDERAPWNSTSPGWLRGIGTPEGYAGYPRQGYPRQGYPRQQDIVGLANALV